MSQFRRSPGAPGRLIEAAFQLELPTLLAHPLSIKIVLNKLVVALEETFLHTERVIQSDRTRCKGSNSKVAKALADVKMTRGTVAERASNSPLHSIPFHPIPSSSLNMVAKFGDEVKGKVYVCTGASTGIGRSVSVFMCSIRGLRRVKTLCLNASISPQLPLFI